MTKRSVVFVMGLPRSGTTLVDLLLGAHPEARALGEIEQFGRADRTVVRRGGLCGICEDTCPFWEGAVPREFRRRWFGTMPERIFAQLRAPRRGLYIDLFGADPAARVLSDSSKSLAWMQRRLRDPRDWIGARPHFLMVTRDGRAVLNSWMRKKPDTPIDDHIARWQRLTEEMEAAYERFDGPKARLAYEHVAAEPEAGAADLSRFAGLPLDPAMVRYWEADQHPVGGNVGTRTLILRHQAEARGDADGALPFRPSVASKTDFYAAQGLSIRPDDRWHDELPDDARARFEDLAGGMNRPYAAGGV